MQKTLHIPLYKKVAKELGLTVRELKHGGPFSKTLYIKGNNKICLIAPTDTGFYPQTSRWFSVLANNKMLSEQVLKDLGYTAISSIYFDRNMLPHKKDLLVQLKKNKHFPAIVKPEVGNKGLGIKIVNTAAELQKYAKELYAANRNFMVQRLMFGTEYRVLIINHKVYVVHAKEFPHVTGDGKSTIKQLLREVDKTKVDQNFLASYLKDHTLRLTSVAKKDEKVPYNITRKGSHSYYESADIPKSLQKWADQLCTDVSSPVIGVDVFIPDDFSKFKDYRIIEINASPGFGYLKDRYKDASLVKTICRDVLVDYFNIKK